ncbi:MAG: hypothetical protein OEZ38_06710, partial [Gammaproteobacteria bacterium]|nr:hypothetical protein [Gammaproteobacteria bacterium]
MIFNKNTNIKLKPLYTLLPALLVAGTVNAADFEITRGTFFMSNGVTSSPVEIAVGTAGATPGILVEGTYQASIDQPELLADFDFFGQPVSTYTAQTGVDALTHPAPTIDLVNLTADMSSFYAYWNGNEFNQGNSNASVVDNFDGTYRLSWDSLIVGGPFDSFTGSWVMDMICLTCPPTTPGVASTLSVTQGGVATDGRVLTTGGVFSVSTDITNTTGYIFNWAFTDDAIDGGVAITTDTLNNIDPSGIAPGQYLVSVGVKNGNTSPIENSLSSLVITIVNTGTVAAFTDTDNDGISDDVDGIDNLTIPTQLQLQNNNASSYVLESSAGKLTMGNIAACSYSDSATVSLNNIKNNATTDCAAVANATDITNVVQSGIGGYFNFRVSGLAQNDTVDVIVPLATALPKNAGVRKYSTSDGWKAFSTDTTDKVVSTAGSAGTCPASTATTWGSSLDEGNHCIRISITDGGENDTDGLAN